jgi:hypothetical protein
MTVGGRRGSKVASEEDWLSSRREKMVRTRVVTVEMVRTMRIPTTFWKD